MPSHSLLSILSSMAPGCSRSTPSSGLLYPSSVPVQYYLPQLPQSSVTHPSVRWLTSLTLPTMPACPPPPRRHSSRKPSLTLYPSPVFWFHNAFFRGKEPSLLCCLAFYHTILPNSGHRRDEKTFNETQRKKNQCLTAIISQPDHQSPKARKGTHEMHQD